MGRNVVETLMGAVVLLVALTFVVIAYQSGNVSAPDGYLVSARFHEVGSLGVGSDVRIGGIKVGVVSNQRLDPNTYMAQVELRVRDDVKIPRDSLAVVTSDGLLGSKYLAIQPGGDDQTLKVGEEIKYTQDAVNLEHLLGKMAFGGVKSQESEKSGANRNGE